MFKPGTVDSERTACWLSLLVHADDDQASSGAAALASGSIFRRLFGPGWRQSAPDDELLSSTFLPFSSFASSRLVLIPIGSRENWPAYISRMENTDFPLHSVTKRPVLIIENNRPSEAVLSRISWGKLKKRENPPNELSETKTEVMPGWTA